MVWWKLVSSKCQQILCAVKYWHVQVKIGTAQIENSSSEKLLGVTIDVKRSLEKHIQQIYAKTKAKLKALGRIASFINKK